MTRIDNPRRTRRLQVAFMVLLLVCIAQTTWWLMDEVRYTRTVHTRLVAAYGANAVAAGTTVAPELLRQLERERFRRINRFAWEAAFFLAVLIAAMAVVYRALRDEAGLRRREEDFLAAVSHELKSPLASLRLSVETLAMRDPPAERRSELVHRSLADLARLERMIGNILDVSRLAAGEPHSAPAHVALADEVSAVMAELREYAAHYESAVRTEIPASVSVIADPEGVRTIVRNLLHNAVNATKGGGGVVVRAGRSDGRVWLEVCDDGVGFAPKEATRLFEKFYRAPHNGRWSGTGLGLYLVSRCARLDGATVSAASAGPGRGASFTVAWPDHAGSTS